MEYHDLTEKIIGCAYRVRNALGAGFLESVYLKSLFIELQNAGLKTEMQRSIGVCYQDQPVGEFFADMVVEDTVIVELKAVQRLVPAHEAQLLNYLVATKMPVGLLLNFADSGVQVKRKHRTYRPRSRAPEIIADPAVPAKPDHSVQILENGPDPVDRANPVHPVKTFDFFLGGVIQGSLQEKSVHSQDYRQQIKAILARRAPDVRVFCPVEEHRSSVLYDDDEARRVFFGHLELVRQSRGMIAYLPVASLGTAIEMEVARQANVPIITISPMALNWVIRLYSSLVFPDLDAFADWASPRSVADFLG